MHLYREAKAINFLVKYTFLILFVIKIKKEQYAFLSYVFIDAGFLKQT